jgi:hypothetical protein
LCRIRLVKGTASAVPYHSRTTRGFSPRGQASRSKGRRKLIILRSVHQPRTNWIVMEIAQACIKVRAIAYPVICKTPLPDWNSGSNSMGEPALDQLHRPFQRALLRRDNQVNVVGHDHKTEELIVPKPPIVLKGLNEETSIRRNLEHSTAIVSSACYEIRARECSARGNCHVLQRTSGAKAPQSLSALAARLKAVPLTKPGDDGGSSYRPSR